MRQAEIAGGKKWIDDDVARGSSWEEGIQVEERKLQEYLHQKKQTMMLQSAKSSLGHTLELMPTSTAQDGVVHFGDSLMLRSGCTEGLLVGDVAAGVQIGDSGRMGFPVYTGPMMKNCPRNVLTISRVRDDDGFENDGHLHYGQVMRLGASPQLYSERPTYLHASAPGQVGDGAIAAAGLGPGEAFISLLPRAAEGTHWRAWPGNSHGRSRSMGGRVALGTPLRLESVATGCELQSESTVLMTNYGNEWRVFGCTPAASSTSRAPSALWSFVDSQWIDGLVASARDSDSRQLTSIERQFDSGELLQDPLRKAEKDLLTLEDEGADVYAVVLRIYPLLRRAGMHVVRRLRSMCKEADVAGDGSLPLRTFQGVICYLGIRLAEGEVVQLAKLFEIETGIIDYVRFFRMMEPTVQDARMAVVKDAYNKLKCSGGGEVCASDLYGKWNPRSHPDVQRGHIAEAEALDDFLRQWDIVTADGIVTYDVFLDYYRDVSAAVENDDLFVELVRSAWGL
eukprot:TRINITY_DN28767_c0_g1_i1.p1 TRINITY_DN28767_c0_g1~~TRINITY_DN28767_c0_g1_i1.p1  ORF type:complete len:510 (-),score=74.37 TRINITY_DN28767_c0_g1_i1:340-1869(-)